MTLLARGQHGAVGRNHALIDAQQVDPPGERVGRVLTRTETAPLRKGSSSIIGDAKTRVLTARQCLDDRVA